MIVGAHVMLRSRNPLADRAFFGGVLNFPSVDAGGGFLIFGVPPAEVAIHDSDTNDVHQLYLMCEDAKRFADEMQRIGIACTEPQQQRWGTLFEITLPGGGKLGVYEPHHARPTGACAPKPRVTKAKRQAPAKRAVTKKKSATPRKAKAKAKTKTKAPPKSKGRRR